MVTTTRTDLFLPLLFLYAYTVDSGSTILDDQVGRAFVAANCMASFYKETFYVRGAHICLNGSSFFYVRGAHICLNGSSFFCVRGAHICLNGSFFKYMVFRHASLSFS